MAGVTGALCVFLLTAASVMTARAAEKALRVYFVDVEGGQATLFVTAAGESLLIDTGWPGNAGADPHASAEPASTPRDADRILAAAKDAGVSRLDYVLITHFHADHLGGVAQLAERIPIGTFIDHGANSEPEREFTKPFYEAYEKLLASGKYKHLIAKPGDILPIKGIQAEVVTSDGSVLQELLPGAGQPNSACEDFHPPSDLSENKHSVGTLFAFGKLRIVDLGDLTSDKEKELLCPENRLGHVDIYIASHHGSESSGSAALVHAIAPRVAIVDNGSRKGGSAAALGIITSSPGLEAMWQLHFAEAAGARNSKPEFIANPKGTEAGQFLKLTAHADGSFEIFNSRTKKTEMYPQRSSSGN